MTRIIGNWVSLMGRDLNGTALNGAILDGRMVTSVSLKGIKVKGKKMKKVSLKGSRFTPMIGQGASKGATMIATLDDGSNLELRVDSVNKGTVKQNKDIYYYQVFFRQGDPALLRNIHSVTTHWQ